MWGNGAPRGWSEGSDSSFDILGIGMTPVPGVNITNWDIQPLLQILGANPGIYFQDSGAPGPQHACAFAGDSQGFVWGACDDAPAFTNFKESFRIVHFTSIRAFGSAVSGETPVFQILGFRAGDAQRTASIGISSAMNNCLSFSGVGTYLFDDNILVERGAGNLFAFKSQVTGDAEYRFRTDANGQIEWGDGTNPRDTTLERVGAGQLKITNSLGIGANPSYPMHVVGSYYGVNTGAAFAYIGNRTDGKAFNVIAGVGGSGFWFDDTGTFIIGAATKANIITPVGSGTVHLTILANGRVGYKESSPASAIDIDDDAGGTNKGYITGEEIAGDPAAPAANHYALYAKDVGGKTAIYARFNTGAVQQIAIEP